MRIPKKVWLKYKNMLSKVDKTAVAKMEAYLRSLGDFDKIPWSAVRYAAAIIDVYGAAAGAGACSMYEAVAEASGVAVRPAEMAELPEIDEVAKVVKGAFKNGSAKVVPGAVGRLVKQVGADTILKNAKRDGAEFAWIPGGDSCPFCLMLASRGWQRAGKDTLKNGHAEHIHAHCDCTYAVRFDGKTTVEGYEPEKYREMYDNAKGDTPEEKLNSMRREIAAGKSKTEKVGKVTLWRRKHPEPIERALRETNPDYRSGPEYQMNCQRCIPAYEMRRRGYIVKAKPALVDNNGLISVNDATIPNQRWFYPFKDMKWSRRGVTREEIEAAMAGFGDGARAEIYIRWTNGRAHAFIAEQSQGKTLFLDPQSGKKDCSSYFTNANPQSIIYARIDGLEPCDQIGLFIESSR